MHYRLLWGSPDNVIRNLFPKFGRLQLRSHKHVICVVRICIVNFDLRHAFLNELGNDCSPRFFPFCIDLSWQFRVGRLVDGKVEEGVRTSNFYRTYAPLTQQGMICGAVPVIFACHSLVEFKIEIVVVMVIERISSHLFERSSGCWQIYQSTGRFKIVVDGVLILRLQVVAKRDAMGV